VCIRIADDGEGMAAETLAQAFDPFFTTRQTHGHAGLG
jgi:signal transduction histidine kinase